MISQGVFEIVNRQDIPLEAQILPSRMVYAIKNKGTPTEKYKTRLTAGEHRDPIKKLMIHDSPKVKKSSVRTISSTASIKERRMWLKEAIQAFIQGHDMTRIGAQYNRRRTTKTVEILIQFSDSGDAWNH